MSEKRKKVNVEYERTVRLWRLERMALDKFRCQFEGCTKKADKSPHHMKHRGKYLCDASTFMAVCMSHHQWITNNGKEAEKLGYLEREYK